MPEHGGYRKPAHPAAVSGPGKLSRRTDGQPNMQLPNPSYGEQSQFQSIQSGAPMAKAPPIATPSSASAPASSPIVPLSAPSQEPDTPVTAGSQYGPGPGPSSLNLQDPTTMDANALRQYLPALIEMADSDNTLPGTRAWVRSIIASVSGS